jgi:hypothetical protein
MKLRTYGFVFIASLPLVALFACSGGDRGSSPDGTVSAGVEPAKASKDTSNSDCARFCAKAFGANTPAASACTAQAAHQAGLCYDCGPKATGGKTLCGQTCVSLQTDTNHCGGCNTVCTAPQNATSTCSGGTCGVVCDPGFADCDGDPSNGCEANLQGDASNCGTCGHACSGDKPACASGTCGCAPPPDASYLDSCSNCSQSGDVITCECCLTLGAGSCLGPRQIDVCTCPSGTPGIANCNTNLTCGGCG